MNQRKHLQSGIQILIQWSLEDDCYLVGFPSLEDLPQWSTCGETTEEALDNAGECLGVILEMMEEK